MIIYCFSGLGADERVFSFLKLDSRYKLVNIEWISPIKNEKLENYSARISKVINPKGPFGILGVSFGGVVAQEVSSILNPNFTIIISSINNPTQAHFLLRITPNFIFKFIPSTLYKLPNILANYVFSAKNKDLLHRILNDTDPEFVKWSLFAFKNWRGQISSLNSFFICGQKDRLLGPVRGGHSIKNAGHFMIVDLANEVSIQINKFLYDYKHLVTI